MKRLEDSQRRRSLASQLQSHSQTDPQLQSNHSTSAEQASLSQNSSQPPLTQSDTTPGSAPLAWSGSASGSGLGSGSKSMYGSLLGSDIGSSLPIQVSSPQMHTPPKQLPQSDPPCWHSPSLSPPLFQPAISVRLSQSLSPPSHLHHQSLVEPQHQLQSHSQQQSQSQAQPQSSSRRQYQPLSQPQFRLPSQLQHQSLPQVQLQQQQQFQPPFWSSAQVTAQATAQAPAQAPAQALSSWSAAHSSSQPAAQPASWPSSQQSPVHLPASQSPVQAVHSHLVALLLQCLIGHLLDSSSSSSSCHKVGQSGKQRQQEVRGMTAVRGIMTQ